MDGQQQSLFPHDDAPKPGHNKPVVTIALPLELAQFLIENCEANMGTALSVLSTFQSRLFEPDREQVEKVVALIENFKAIRKATAEAVDKQG